MLSCRKCNITTKDVDSGSSTTSLALMGSVSDESIDCVHVWWGVMCLHIWCCSGKINVAPLVPKSVIIIISLMLLFRFSSKLCTSKGMDLPYSEWIGLWP